MSHRFSTLTWHVIGKIIFLCLYLTAFLPLLYGQSDPKMDSLLWEIHNGIQDTCQVKSLVRLAERMRYIGEPTLALKYADEAILIGERINFKKGIADAKISKGNVYWHQADYSEALKNYKEAVQLYEALKNQFGLVLCYENIGSIFQAQGNYEQALKNYLGALTTSEAAGDKIGAASISNRIGSIYKIQNNYLDARKYFLKALQIGEEIVAKREIAGSYSNLGQLEEVKGNYKEAINYLLNALRTSSEIGDSVEIASTHIRLGYNYQSQGNISAALDYFLKAHKFLLKSGYKHNLAASHGHLGFIYNLQGNYSEAIKHYFEAIKIFEEIGHKKNVAFTYNHIASIYSAQEHYQNAQENYTISLHISEEIGDKEGVALSNFLLGNVDRAKRLYPEALDKYTRALKIYEELEMKSGIANVRNSIGDVYEAQGLLHDAFLYYVTSLSIVKEIGAKLIMAECYNDMGNIQMRFQNPIEARKLLDTCLSISLGMGYKHLIGSTYRDLSRADSMLGNFELALEHFKLYTLYKDSLLNESNGKLITEMQTKYETEKKDKEIKDLESEKLISNLELKVHQEALSRIKLEKEKILTENLFNLSQVDLLANEKRLQQLEIEKNAIELAMQKAETDRSHDQVTLLHKDDVIQKLEIKKQTLLKNYFLGGLLLFSLLAFFIYNHYVTRQKLKLQALRIKIASDLHDDVGGTLSSISIFAEMAKQQSKEVIPMLDTIGESSRKMLDAMADIVWTINPENDQFGKIILRMRGFAYDLLRAKKIDFEFQADEELAKIRLPMEIRKNLYLIFKEATNNMVKYSDADRAVFSVKGDHQNLVMMIRDNGKGFDLAQSSSGNGLKNMKRRAEEVGGKLNIETRSGEGTTIYLHIALRA